jgi:hypothetical protein
MPEASIGKERPRYEVGDRVGAILGFKDGIAEFLGYGKYEGEQPVSEEAVGMFAELCRMSGRSNPCILLDNGKRVYGCECWWGSEEKIKSMLQTAKEVKEVDIDEVRALIKRGAERIKQKEGKEKEVENDRAG